MPRGGSGRQLATVLFTDIVGSTELATALDDRRWEELLRRHHSIVRRDLKRFGGRERDTAGDGFFATFEQPTNGVRLRFNPSTLDPLPTVRFHTEVAATDVAVGEGYAWVTFRDGDVQKLDQFTARPLERYHVEGSLDVVAVGEGGVWVLDEVAGVVTRLDSAIGEIVASITVSPNARAIVAGESGLWVLDTQASTVTRIDAATNRLEAPIGPVGDGPNGLAIGLGAVWVPSDDGMLVRIEPLTGQTTSIDAGVPLTAIAVDEGTGTIWLAVETT